MKRDHFSTFQNKIWRREHTLNLLNKIWKQEYFFQLVDIYETGTFFETLGKKWKRKHFWQFATNFRKWELFLIWKVVIKKNIRNIFWKTRTFYENSNFFKNLWPTIINEFSSSLWALLLVGRSPVRSTGSLTQCASNKIFRKSCCERACANPPRALGVRMGHAFSFFFLSFLFMFYFLFFVLFFPFTFSFLFFLLYFLIFSRFSFQICKQFFVHWFNKTLISLK